MTYNYEFEQGATLLIELNSSEIYEADFEYGNPNFITVGNVSLYPSTLKQDSCFKFYKNEIVSIREVKENIVLTSEKENRVLTSEKEQKDAPTVAPYQQYEELQEQANKHIYISTIDDNYHKAIEHLQSLSFISVVGEGSQYGRLAGVNLLIIGTKLEIYIFDVKLAGSQVFDKGLREILEDDEILKIIHNSRMFADSLQHAHQVNLNYVFDVQVSDFMLVHRDKGEMLTKMRTFSEILQDYLNLSATCELHAKTDTGKFTESATSSVIVEETLNCKQLGERPMPEGVRRRIAIKAAYLYVLKTVMARKMKYNFYFATECYLNSLRDLNDELIAVADMRDDLIPAAFTELDEKLF